MDKAVLGVALDAATEPAAREFAPRRVLAVFNPAAGQNNRPRFERIVGALRATGCTVTVIETKAPGHAESIAGEITDDFDIVAAAGGDGTVNEIVNGLRAKDSGAGGKAAALALIPLGTANVLADEIGLARSPQAVATAIARGPIRPIHIGSVNGRRFVMMAGAGFDANVVAGVSLALKKRLGPLAYVWQAARQAFVADQAACDVIVDGASHSTASVVVCNGRRYGGPFIAAPNASLADDLFHIVLMPGRGAFHVARYGIALMLGRIAKLGDVRLVTGRDVWIRGVPGRPVQADGDIVAVLPAHVVVDPEPIRLVFPA